MSSRDAHAADAILKFPNTGSTEPPKGAPLRKRTPTRRRHQPVLITGGSGFVGTNLANRLCAAGEQVLLYDNLSRAGVEQNAAWLWETHGDLVQVENADVRDEAALTLAVRSASAVYHLAAQVAVTSSLTGPIEDFEINARGMLNLLEAARGMTTPPPVIFTSTNKVYGHLDDVELRLNGPRYEPVDEHVRRLGISEAQPLDFYSPYGCSKGAADQYIVDYARTFGLPGVVFRMSCIYGPHQFGTEDQGWVAHFLIQAMNRAPITLYGDGKQVRDVLFVEDLVDALLLARKNIRSLSGQVFNLGGGPANTTSLLEILDWIAELDGAAPDVSWGNWRPGDQRYYVSNFAKFEAATGWQPKVAMRDGVQRLHEWLREFREYRRGDERAGDGLMRAAVIAEPRRVEIEEVAVPQPAADQVLVRLEGCGVCASNIPPWEGKPWFTYPMAPGALGHESWGRVEDVGGDVTGFAPGDRVALISNNAYAEYDVASDSAVVKLTHSLDQEAFPAEPLGCAMNIFKRAAIQKSDTVAIVGIGFLGALLTQLATAAGARVIAITRREFALQFARKAGAAHTIVMDDHNRIIDEVKQLTGGGFCDVVIEAVGKQWPLDLSGEFTRERGRLVIAGYHQDEPRQVNMQLWNWRGLDVINAHERDPAIYLEGMREAVRAVETGTINPRPLYTHEFPLEQLGDALNMTAQRPDGFMKALIRM